MTDAVVASSAQRDETVKRHGLIEMRGVEMRFRAHRVLQRHQPDDPPGRDRLHHRRERLRQDRHAQADHRPASSHGRERAGSTGRTSRSWAARSLSRCGCGSASCSRWPPFSTA